LDIVDNDARVVHALGVFDAPEFFAVLVGDRDGFVFEWNGRALGVWRFNDPCLTSG
jgi:hypothetical protein